MAKDPAILFYYDNWLTATAEMDSDVKSWYLHLLIHDYDKKGLPNNIETLASLAGVKFSEYERFKQMFEQVLKHKFELNQTNGRFENPFAQEIIRKRENFIEKRSLSGKLSYFIKYLRKNGENDINFIEFIKENKEILKDIDTKNEQMLEQVFKQTRELYINGDGDGSIDINKNSEGGGGGIESKDKKIPTEEEFLNYCKSVLSEKYPSLEFSLKAKFESWVENKWKDGNNNKIKNWKSKIKNTIPFLRPDFKLNGHSKNSTGAESKNNEKIEKIDYHADNQ